MTALVFILILMSSGALVLSVYQFLWIRSLLNDLKLCEQRLDNHLGSIVAIDVLTTKLSYDCEGTRQVLAHQHTRLEELLILCQNL